MRIKQKHIQRALDRSDGAPLYWEKNIHPRAALNILYHEMDANQIKTVYRKDHGGPWSRTSLAIGNTIYLSHDMKDAIDAVKVPILAHELTHIRAWTQIGSFTKYLFSHHWRWIYEMRCEVEEIYAKHAIGWSPDAIEHGIKSFADTVYKRYNLWSLNKRQVRSLSRKVLSNVYRDILIRT